jgi:alpha/beta superfamily hydrolase
MIAEHPVQLITADGVALEALEARVTGARGGLVACHPHPLYGGDMDNPVVVRAVEIGQSLGLVTLRFNFRGVGTSGGTHGEGIAEEGDVRAALDHVAHAVSPSAPVLLVGYSFGARVAARVAATRSVRGVALIAPPLATSAETEPLPVPSSVPLLVIAGDRDEYCPPAALGALHTALPHATVRVVEGANHFFFGKLYPLGDALQTWARSVLDGA